jgi:prepilin-type N-terminal cleavage/methylation domain-containing protein
MTPKSLPRPSLRSRGFTLVELLVVITIVVILASVTFSIASKMMARAASATAFSNLRQSGMILLSDAQEKGNKLSFFSGGASGGFDLRPYNIVRAHLGKPQGQWNNKPEHRIDIMHWNPKKVPPNNFHWNCYAVNFSDNEEAGSFWRIENGRPDGSNGRILSIPAVRRPESVPMLMDSSTPDGSEIFRVGVVANELPALRNAGKCHAFYIDGTARALTPSELKTAGFKSAYDTSAKPPKVIRF